MRTLLFLTLLIALPGSTFAADPIDTAKVFLNENRVYEKKSEPSDKLEAVTEVISAKADPETKFGFVVFSVARHSEKLLSEEQAKALDEVIEARKKSEVNWHDVRNIVRVHAQMRMWKYAAEPDSLKAVELKSEWKAWNDLRMEFMFQEFIAQERFQRAAWNILTAEQKTELRSGKWDSFLKKSTGHGRLFSANKQVIRVLGKPDHKAEFDAAVVKWEAAWAPILKKYKAASLFQRKREFSMDDAGEDFAAFSWIEYKARFREFSETEAAAIRGVLQAGYEVDADLHSRITIFENKLKSEMVKKYEAKAAEFLRQLEVM